jgi:hypothetical protein
MVRCSDLNDLVDTWEVRWPNYLNWFGRNPTISNWTVNYIHHFYFPTSFWYPNLAPLESIWPAWRNPFTVWIWRVDHVVPWKKRDEVYRSVYLFNLFLWQFSTHKPVVKWTMHLTVVDLCFHQSFQMFQSLAYLNVTTFMFWVLCTFFVLFWVLNLACPSVNAFSDLLNWERPNTYYWCAIFELSEILINFIYVWLGIWVDHRRAETSIKRS